MSIANKLDRVQLVGSLGARFKHESKRLQINVMHSYRGGVELAVALGGTSMGAVLDPDTAKAVGQELIKLASQAREDETEES